MLPPFVRLVGMLIAAGSVIALVLGIFGYNGLVGTADSFFVDPSCGVVPTANSSSSVCHLLSGTMTSVTKRIGRKGSWYVALGVISPRGQETVSLQPYVGQALLTDRAGVDQPVSLQIYRGLPVRVLTSIGAFRTNRFPLTTEQKTAVVIMLSLASLLMGLILCFGKARRRF